MGVSMIDGTISAITPGRRKGKLSVWKEIVFELRSGGAHVVRKGLSSGAVSDHIAVGSSGRFYLYKTIDLNGIHGVRTGAVEAFEYPGQNLKLFTMIVGVSIVLILLNLIFLDSITFIGLFTLVIGAVGYALTRQSIAEAREQFANDRTFRGDIA